MRKSLRTRDALVKSHLNLFRFVVEIDPCTAVPPATRAELSKEDVSRLAKVASWGVLSAWSAPVPAAAPRSIELTSLVPIYDLDRRELKLAGFVIRRFSKPADNQEPILKAFQEENWPPKVDDPLPGPCDDPFKRLQDTLFALNNAIEKAAREADAPYYVRFSANGTGEGICWLVKSTAK